jgi:sulfonate transport system permease protein
MAESAAIRLDAGSRGGRFANRTLISTISVATFLVLWEVAPRLHLVDVSFTSRPSLVVAASVEILRGGGFLRDVSVSLSEFALGFSMALVVGVTLGLLLGMFPVLRYLIDPPIMAIYATPELALLPIIVVWLGIGMSSKVAVVFVGAVIPIIINSIVAVRQVDRSLIIAARSFCAKEREVFTKVILPASLPAMMIGIRFGWSRAVLAVVVAEMYVSQEGIGNQIMLFGSAFRVAPLLFYVLMVSAFGFAGTTILRKIEERVGY